MALTNVQIANTPNYSDLPFMNYGVTDIPANRAVSIDATNLVGTGTNAGIGVKVVAADGDVVVGVTMEIIPAGGVGRVRTGGIAPCIADGAITAGTFVDASAQAGNVGYVKAHGAGKATVGIALATSAADDDVVPVLIALGFNA